jgi:hypothetical protein
LIFDLVIATVVLVRPLTIEITQQREIIEKLECRDKFSHYNDSHDVALLIGDRQLKSRILEIHVMLLNKTLNRLHSILRASNRLRLIACFVLLLGLAIVTEKCKNLIDCGLASGSEAMAERVELDEAFDFLCVLFRSKYCKRLSQKLRLADITQKAQDAGEAQFLTKIEEVIDRHGKRYSDTVVRAVLLTREPKAKHYPMHTAMGIHQQPLLWIDFLDNLWRLKTMLQKKKGMQNQTRPRSTCRNQGLTSMFHTTSA